MLETEVRYPCPVCLGVALSKVPLASRDELTLDRCRRCGGIWFEEGKVEQLKRLRFARLRQKIRPPDSAFRMACHGCEERMDRNAEQCPACGWGNLLDCPVCVRLMKRREVEGMFLDYCNSCRGVWFDQIEVTEIWNMRAVSTAARSAGIVSVFPEETVDFARDVAEKVFDLTTGGVELIGGVLETTGEVSGAVFEAIGNVVSTVLS